MKAYYVHKANQVSMKSRVAFHAAVALWLCPPFPCNFHALQKDEICSIAVCPIRI